MKRINIEEISRRLKPLFKRNNVKKAIVFGSSARGTQTRKSDLDLLIVLATDKRFFDRYEDFEEIPNLITALCKFINSDTKSFLHPILKAIILHFMIGYLHPFRDGNGRTARALFYWYVLKRGYWLSEFMPISLVIKRAPARYSRAYIYTETDDNDITYFMVFNLRQLKIALKNFIHYVKQKRDETEKVKEILRKDNRLNFRQSDMILRFMRHPLKKFSINEIKQIYNVVYETARSDLDFLTHLGYCEKMKEGKKFVYSYSKPEER